MLTDHIFLDLRYFLMTSQQSSSGSPNTSCSSFSCLVVSKVPPTPRKTDSDSTQKFHPGAAAFWTYQNSALIIGTPAWCKHGGSGWKVWGRMRDFHDACFSKLDCGLWQWNLMEFDGASRTGPKKSFQAEKVSEKLTWCGEILGGKM